MISGGWVCSSLKTLPGCRVYLGRQILNVNIVVIVPILLTIQVPENSPWEP